MIKLVFVVCSIHCQSLGLEYGFGSQAHCERMASQIIAIYQRGGYEVRRWRCVAPGVAT